MQKLFVKDIMTSPAVIVRPEDTILRAAKLLVEKGFNGLPVVDVDGKLVGIVTEYDLISHGDSLHLPTLIKILGDLDIYKKDKSLIKDDLSKLLSMKVNEVMNREPIFIRDEANIQMLVELFASHHRVNPIPVVDDMQKVIGVVSRFDLVRFFADKDSFDGPSGLQTEAKEARVDQFLSDFEKRFVVVSKSRIKFWPLIGLLLIIAGFAIAMVTILRVVMK